MDGERFDGLIRGLGNLASRRSTLRVLAGIAAAPLTGLRPGAGRAAGCERNGQPCTRGGQCCSGRCSKKRCRRAPGQGTCTIKRDVCRVGQAGIGCNGGDDCQCTRTVRGASFCAQTDDGADLVACEADAECANATGPGSVCVDLCADEAAARGVGPAVITGTFCFAPCAAACADESDCRATQTCLAGRCGCAPGLEKVAGRCAQRCNEPAACGAGATCLPTFRSSFDPGVCVATAGQCAAPICDDHTECGADELCILTQCAGNPRRCLRPRGAFDAARSPERNRGDG